jgi:hypothetical protein
MYQETLLLDFATTWGLHLVLTSPDAEMARPQISPVAQIPQPFILPHHDHFPLQSEQLWTVILDSV